MHIFYKADRSKRENQQCVYILLIVSDMLISMISMVFYNLQGLEGEKNDITKLLIWEVNKQIKKAV